MQNMNTQSGDRTVYVKTVAVTDLPQDVQQQAGDRDQIYAVHNAMGEQIALVGDRKLAFSLARQHDYAPVMVH